MFPANVLSGSLAESF